MKQSFSLKKNFSARAGARTLDRQVKSLTLYRLSYPGNSLAWYPRQKKKKIEIGQTVETIKSELPDRESNPGLPRDRRRSSPLDHRGLDRSPIANRSTTSTPDKSKRDISKRRLKYSNCIVQHMAMSGDQILANQNTAQITCTLVWYVDRESCSRALYTVDIWDGPAIKLFFTKCNTYILNSLHVPRCKK